MNTPDRLVKWKTPIMKVRFIYYQIKFWCRKKNWNFPFHFREYGDNKITFSDEERDQMLANAIINEIPFFVGKFGATEMYAMRTEEFGNRRHRRKACKQLCCCAGFFPDDVNLMESFNSIMKDAAMQLDLVEKWDKPCEEYFVNKYCLELKGFCLHMGLGTDSHPWSSALKNRKVLVIHPFEDSIRKQYKKRKELFKGADILPEFDLITIKAVQTQGDAVDSRFANWFEALDYMKSEIDKLDFDIALIGCGAYGLPLGAYIKEKRQKVAIHLGGDVQLLFGIMGKRWEDNPRVSSLRNEFWIYPDETERPAGAGKVENGCYW
ncbi:MAG: hypothetical protein LIO67_01390 [Lachnospiraceae bacterium]|nr:hypothetical protein [Lachnospiraceae bacterium]